jgi:hypothetical protein
MPYTTYQSTWQNPYTTTNPYGMSPVTPATTLPYTQQSVNGITKVNGRESAVQYNLPPNSMSPALFDKNGKTFYIVSTDGTGAKTVEAFDFSPHKEEQSVTIDGAQFVSRKEFDDFAAKVNAVLGAQNGIHAAVPAAEPAQSADVNAEVDSSGGHVGDGAKPRSK